GGALNSNFQQSQAGGAGANALAYDVAVSWPWLAPAAQIEVERQANPANTSGADTGYDYRTVWTGKGDAYAASGQAIEIFQRGNQKWDDSQGFSCGGESIPCPSEGPDLDGVVVVVMYFQSSIISFGVLDHFPTRAELCEDKPTAESTLIAGMGVLVTIVDTGVADYDITQPGSVGEWLNRLGLALLKTSGRIICNNDVNIEDDGLCWCVSHDSPVTGTPLGLVALYMTPTTPESAFDLAAPRDKQCKELSTRSNMAVFIHKTDTTKDYLCYHRLTDD
ncbi:hypothetical protein LCGC14_2413460, partial [marine sediment metagenome]